MKSLDEARRAIAEDMLRCYGHPYDDMDIDAVSARLIEANFGPLPVAVGLTAEEQADLRWLIHFLSLRAETTVPRLARCEALLQRLLNESSDDA